MAGSAHRTVAAPAAVLAVAAVARAVAATAHKCSCRRGRDTAGGWRQKNEQACVSGELLLTLTAAATKNRLS